MKPTRELNKRLFEIAESQDGLFTAKQAEEAGFIRTNHAYHVKMGDWIREERGIYRLALFPMTRDVQLVTYSLWSMNRKSEIQGVYSNETALSYYDLSDVNPAKLQMTVPTLFRRSREAPGVLVLFYADLDKKDFVATGHGYFVTTPLKTLHDVIQEERVSFEFIRQAVQQSIERRLVTRADLQKMLTELKNTMPAIYLPEIDQLLKRAA